MKLKRSEKILLGAALLGVWFASVIDVGAAQMKFDWLTLEDEAIGLLRRYVQIDTTNPPGNEAKAAQFLKSIFEREAIESRVIEAAPGRANFYGRLRGDGSKKAVVLMHHMDVVPADGQLWKVMPFSGALKDGEIWGRGAIDDKGGGIMMLMTVLALKRQNVHLKGDLIFLGTADEEAGGELGAGFLVEKHVDLFKNVGVVFNEGGGIRVGSDGKAKLYTVRVSEKTPLWLRLTARGRGGHAASPGPDQAVLKLITALNRISAYQSPIKVVPEVQKFYFDTAESAPAGWRERYLDLRRALQDSKTAAEFTRDRSNNARVRNTISITRFTGSDKINVIPAEATAEIDVRLLPGEAADAFITQLRKVMRDDSIRIDVLLSRAAATATPSPDGLRAITDFANQHDPEALIISQLGPGFTDCHFFHVKGIPCLGFLPQRSTARSEGLVHGVDERISVERLTGGLRGMYEIVTKLIVD